MRRLFSPTPVAPQRCALPGYSDSTRRRRRLIAHHHARLARRRRRPSATTSPRLISSCAIVDVQADTVWMDLLPAAAPCQRPSGLAPMSGAAPYKRQFSNLAAGSYKLYVETSPAVAAGSVTVDPPVATYDIHSTQTGKQSPPGSRQPVIVLRILSWQLN